VKRASIVLIFAGLTRISLAVFLVIFTALLGFAQEGTIMWLQYDLPPAYIFEGKYRGQGMQGMVDQYLGEHMPEYHHKISKSNLKRVEAELKSEKHVVCGGLLKTPDREAQFEVSIPHAISLSAAVIIRRDRLGEFQPFLDSEGNLELERVLTQSDLTVGIALGRQYSGIIDDSLSKHQGHPNIYVRAGGNISDGLLKMLMASRIDYSILYPYEVQYVARSMQTKQEMISLPIKGMPPYGLIVAVAPKNAWGKRVIAKINAVLRPARNTLQFHTGKEAWLDDPSKERHRHYVQKFFAE
jgi:uncharacterized protein (TIGR02285 family)